MIERKGAATIDVLAEILPAIIKSFPVAEIDALGRALCRARLRCAGCARCIRSSRPSGRRPRSPRSCPFRSTASQPGNVDSTAIASWRRGAITVRRFDDYVPALDKAKVVLDPARRRDIILHDARDLAFAQGLELVEDEGAARTRSRGSSNGRSC